MHGVVLKARRHDIGNPIDWLKTNLVFARRDPEIWGQIRPLVQQLLQIDRMQPIRTVVVGYGYAGARIHVPLIRLAPG